MQKYNPLYVLALGIIVFFAVLYGSAAVTIAALLFASGVIVGIFLHT